MKIAHVVQRYVPAPLTGSEIFVESVSKFLANRGHKVDILTSTAIDWNAFYNLKNKRHSIFFEKLDNLNVYRFPIHYEVLLFFKLLRKINNKWIKSSLLKNFVELNASGSSGPQIPGVYLHIIMHEYDLIHALPFPFSYMYFLHKISKKRGIPFIATPLFHYKLHEYYNPFLLEVIRNSNSLIACTNFERNLLLRLGAKCCFVVPPGICTEEWKTVKHGDIRKSYGLENYFIVLIPHRGYRKGAYHTLMALTLLKERGVDVAVVAIGQFFMKKYITWKRYAESKGVKVIDFGYISDDFKRKLFADADVIVMPSIADAYGISYLEAWAVGKPVIAARTPVMAEVIRDAIDGFLVEFGNEVEIAEKLALLAKDSELSKSFGENGKKKVFETHDWNLIGRRLEEIYFTTLGY